MIDGASSLDGSLILFDSDNCFGADEFGNYSAITMKWRSGLNKEGQQHKTADNSDNILWTSVRTYTEDQGMVVFEQYFPTSLGAADVGESSARSIFPAFSTANLGPASDYFAYHDEFPRIISCTLDTYEETPQGGTPFILYDSTDKDLPMVVLSPLNSPNAQHMATIDGIIGAGIKATATYIPQGTSQLFVLSAGMGITKGMDAWGNRLRTVTKRPKTDKYVDVTHSSIGFWTDRGGYYHYSTGDGNGNYVRTYEEILPEVKAYHDSLSVPFRHWQFDSWLYPKDAEVNTAGAAEP